MHYAVESATIDRPGQLVVAIMGRMTAEDANTLLRVRRNRAQGLAMVLDVDTFADEPGSERQRAQHELAGADPAGQPVAGDRGPQRGTWVVDARPGRAPWSSLVDREGRLMRASDRSGIAVIDLGRAGRHHRCAR